MKLLSSLLAASFLLAASGANAGKLAGKNVILIQGFLPQHVFLPPSDGGQADGVDYWKSFPLYNNGQGDSNRNGIGDDDPHAKILHFSSAKRIEEPDQSGSGLNVVNQLKQLFASEPGYCAEGCVVVTHSTGDLVMRYVMDNSHLLDQYENHLNVVAFVDLAGAGGGTEGAVWLNAVANGANIPGAIAEGLAAWLGGDLNAPGLEPGILYDLQPSVARNTSVDNIPAIPRLRVASAGEELYGLLTHLFIKGTDDSVVPLHSACGAAFDGAYDSCTRDLRIDGRVKNGVNGPSTYYDYHYPIIMSEEMPHNDQFKGLGWDFSSGYPWLVKGRDMTFALSGAKAYENGTANQTVDVDVEYETVYAWWDWFRKYRLISNASSKSMGQVVMDSFE